MTHEHGSDDVQQLLPRTLAQRWMRPLALFLRQEAASGIVLLVCTALTLGLANSPWSAAYLGFWETKVTLAFGGVGLAHPLSLAEWINDGLMVLFFFVVGLEIKRELVAGELREPRKAALPVLAALGGMLAPAGIYLALQFGQSGEHGWGVPMATDIAFVVGVSALLGPRVPFGLKILLLSLAIADDIGAILVIAVFYASDVSFVMLAFAAVGFAILWLCNRAGIRQVTVYVVIGAAIWLAFFKSGVHPTIAGVLLGFMTPAKPWIGAHSFLDIVGRLWRRQGDDSEPLFQLSLGLVEFVAREAESPLERLEKRLHPWVAFAIMPIFALANAGVVLQPAAAGHSVAWAVALGLLVGKPVGIVAFSWLAVRAGLAKLPSGVTWPVLWGGGCLGGIGFTMALFVAQLAFDQPILLDPAKIGILAGSLVSAAVGSALLMVFLRDRKEAA